MMKIKIFTRAKNDMLEIVEYIKKDNIDAAYKLLDRFYEIFQNIAEYPGIGVNARDEYIYRLGYKLYIVDKYNILYTVNEDEVQIKRVIHSARNMKKIF